MSARLPSGSPTVRTTCPYCGVGCGVLATPNEAGGVEIAGDPDHPANFGRLCSKGSALGETVGLEGRLLYPQVNGERASWDHALQTVASGLQSIGAAHGPDSIGFYLSGQLLTEDYYVANRLMKGFIGSANVDTNSRLCMSSSVAGHRRAFGADIVPACYEDLDEADLLVLVGSNAAWCHPVLFRRMLDNRMRRGARIVVIDPRRTATGDEADLFLRIAAGTDSILFSGLLVDLAETGSLNDAYLAQHTAGFGEALERARSIAPNRAEVARLTGLDEEAVGTFYELFRTIPRTVTCYSQGVNQSAQGTDKVGAIVNCHLATGRIGRVGMGPFSLTGQPNAMGGREVGGLANMLAAHMNYGVDEIDRVRRFWSAPNLVTAEGLKAVELFDAIDEERIKALWIMATNPAVSMPEADRIRASLAKLELLVVSENVERNDTISRGAHVLLPAAAWGEKDGTVTNSERRISRQRNFLPLPTEVRPDWWIMSEVGLRMGFGEAFAYDTAADVFREHAALTAFENGGTRPLDLGGVAALSRADYDAMTPVQWPVRSGEGETARLFAEGGFVTADRRARLILPETPALATETSAAFPFRLNTGRVRDHWHTMTRTGRSPRLGSHRAVPYLDIHPEDAGPLCLSDGDLARVVSESGEAVLEVSLTEGQEPGTVFAPIHWTEMTSSHGRIGGVVHGRVDPFSGQPESKATPVRIAPVPMAMRGFVLSRDPIFLPPESWWAKAAISGGWGTLFAAPGSATVVAAWLPDLVPDAELAEYSDPAADVYRAAAFRGGQLVAVLYTGPAAARPQWETAKAMFADASVSPEGRTSLSGGATGRNEGPLVCSCFGVGLATIRQAIEGGATTTELIGKALRAGTNCGSCVPELRRILTQDAAAIAA